MDTNLDFYLPEEDEYDPEYERYIREMADKAYEEHLRRLEAAPY